MYSQVGENASVFDVVNGRVKPREVSISSLSEPSPASPTNAQGSAGFSIDEIAQTVLTPLRRNKPLDSDQLADHPVDIVAAVDFVQVTGHIVSCERSRQGASR